MGRAPMGSSRCGYGSAATSTALGTADLEGGREISSVTSDYVVSADGTLERMSVTQQSVLLALRTWRDSSSVEAFGLGAMPPTRKAGFDADVRASVEAALSHLIEDHSIEILSIERERDVHATRATYVVRWRDIRTREELTNRV